ncbi:MAG: pilus assembly protein PilM [Planctomycetota bacterium]|jgi:type IV pilus assembly protein PilM
MINWKFKNGGRRPIGLDIGHRSIKMIQLAIDGGRIAVLAAAKTQLESAVSDDPKDRRCFIVSAIKRMLADGKFRGRNVVSCLPNDQLKITSLRLGDTGSEQIESALAREVMQRFGMDPSRDTINYMLAGDVLQGDEVKNEFVVFAADNESVKSHIELLEEAGLRPVGIDAVPCALFRTFERLLQREQDKEHSAVFIDVGSRFTTVVFGRGREVSFVKQIPIGGSDFNQEIAAKLGIGLQDAQILRDKLSMGSEANEQKSLWTANRDLAEKDACSDGQKAEVRSRTLDASTRQVMVDAVGAVAEKLAKEISLCFRYYTVTFRGKRVGRAVFSGGEAYERILLNVLRRQLAVEIEVAQPLKGFDMMNLNFDSDRRGLLCEWAVAVGLSLKGWSGQVNEDRRCLVVA